MTDARDLKPGDWTNEEAEAAFDAAPSLPVSDEWIEAVIDRVLVNAKRRLIRQIFTRQPRNARQVRAANAIIHSIGWRKCKCGGCVWLNRQLLGDAHFEYARLAAGEKRT